MTETPILDESAVEEIEVRANAATEGPWAVWDSNSWRRIGTADPFRDGNVLCPITQRDGHPDLAATREDLEFVAHAREDVPALCATVKHLRARLDSIKSKTAWHRDGIGPDVPVMQERYDNLIAQRNDLQSQLEHLRAERDRFSELADKRHDDLCEARRQRDSLATKHGEFTRDAMTAAVNDFRKHVIQLCKDKAAVHDMHCGTQFTANADCDCAAKQFLVLATELEQL